MIKTSAKSKNKLIAYQQSTNSTKYFIIFEIFVDSIRLMEESIVFMQIQVKLIPSQNFLESTALDLPRVLYQTKDGFRR